MPSPNNTSGGGGEGGGGEGGGVGGGEGGGGKGQVRDAPVTCPSPQKPPAVRVSLRAPEQPDKLVSHDEEPLKEQLVL